MYLYIMNIQKQTQMCSECNGGGLTKCERIQCGYCKGAPGGCFRSPCKGGYIQHNYKECSMCIGSGII